MSLIDTTKLATLKRDRHIEGDAGIWMKVPETEIRLLTLAATDANPAFVDLWPKMQAELRRLEGVGATKSEIAVVRAGYYARMFLRGFKNVPAVDGGEVPFSQPAAVELLLVDDILQVLAETVFETRNFRMARARETTEDLKNS